MNIFRLHLSILIIGCNFCLSEDEFNISELNLVDQTFYKLNSVVLDQGLIYQNINGNKIYVRAEGQVDPMILSSILGLE